MFVTQGNYEEAVHEYTAALKLERRLLTALNNRAMAYLKLGSFAEAEVDCTAALELDPVNVKIVNCTAALALDPTSLPM
eukprot:1178762-Prorocentrum_minimum.AAC.1